MKKQQLDIAWNECVREHSQATSSRAKWEVSLRMAAIKPHFFVGAPHLMHIDAIRNTLRAVYESSAFRSIGKSKLVVSPCQYAFSVAGGSLEPAIDRIVDWTRHYTIVDALVDARQRYYRGELEDGEWRKAFEGPSPPSLERPTYPAYLAESFCVGLKTEAGIWYQAYRQGTPENPPELIDTTGEDPCFFTAASLNSTSFTGLPYGQADILALVNECCRSDDVEVEWSAHELFSGSVGYESIANVLVW